MLTRIIDVVIFLGGRGLAFSGSSLRIGLLELLAHYDALLEEHVTIVKVAQQKGDDCKLTTFHQNRKMSSLASVLLMVGDTF